MSNIIGEPSQKELKVFLDIVSKLDTFEAQQFVIRNYGAHNYPRPCMEYCKVIAWLKELAGVSWNEIANDILKVVPEYKAKEELLRKRIEDIDFGVYRNVRIQNALIVTIPEVFNKPPVCTIGDLLDYSEAELYRVPNLGRTSINSMKQYLADNNLALREYPS